MAAAKKPTAQQKAQAKARAGGNDPIKVTKAGVKRLGKGALIAASLTPTGRGVKVAASVAKAAKMLSKEEKFAVKFVKDIAKKGKPGDVQKTLDALPAKTKEQFSKALRKAGGDRSAVYKKTKQANISYQKIKVRSTGSSNGKVVKFDSAGNIIKKPK
jgi:hypothetical protein